MSPWFGLSVIQPFYIFEKRNHLCAKFSVVLLLLFSSHSKFPVMDLERIDSTESLKGADSNEQFVCESVGHRECDKLCNMAADHISELASMENSNRSARPGFCSDKYSLLVIVGLPGPAGFVDLLVSEIERGKHLSYCVMGTE